MTKTSRIRRATGALVRFTPDEMVAARDRAHAAGRPLAVYLRECALRAVPKARTKSYTGDIVHQLSRIATALRALSLTADPNGSVPEGLFAPVLGEVMAVMRRLTAAHASAA